MLSGRCRRAFDKRSESKSDITHDSKKDLGKRPLSNYYISRADTIAIFTRKLSSLMRFASMGAWERVIYYANAKMHDATKSQFASQYFCLISGKLLMSSILDYS